MSVELYEHQKNALQKMRNGCILWGGVGSGKTLTAAAYYTENEAPAHIYVITTAKKRDDLDWEAAFVKFGIGRTASVPGFGKLVVDSWNNIGKYTDVEDAFFIFDEQRLVGSGAWVKAFYRIAKKNRWILLSATPGDTWLDYAPIFIANGFFKNLTQFKREHVLYEPFVKFPKVRGYLEQRTLEKYRNLILVEMPYEGKNRIVEYVETEHDLGLYERIYRDRWNIYTEAPIADVSELFRALRRLSGEDPDRLDTVLRLLDEHKKAIIFYNFNYELDILRGLKDHGYDLGEWNGHRKTPIPTSESWAYLVQYTSGAEGWNCVSTDTTIFYSPTYSWKTFEQSQGRIDRLDSPFEDLYYYVLYSDTPVDRGILKALERKEIFNERAWLEKQKK